MAFSLHKKKTSPYWFAYIRYPDPNDPERLVQTSKSTKEKTKEAAKKKAAEIEQAILSEAGAGEEKSRELYAVLREACDEAIRGALNEARARVYLSEMLRISSGEGVKIYTVREWFDSWLADKEKANARGTYLRYKGVVKDFLDFLPDSRSEGNLLNLTAEDVRAFRDAEYDAGKSPNTVNDAVKTVRTSLNKAKRSQVLLSNPADAVEFLTEDAIEKTVFSPADLLKLLEAANDEWRGAILIGYYTGASLRDVTNLRWSQIDVAKGLVDYRRKKTGRGIVAPLHAELAEWIATLPASDDPKAFLFPSLAGKVTSGKSGLSMAFNRIMEKAGLKGESHAPREAKEEGQKSKGRTRNTLTFTSLRHTFNSAMANAGVSPEIRSKLTGHASTRMNAHYTHLDIETFQKAVGTVKGIREAAEEKEEK